VRSRERLADVLLETVCPGDLVLLLGAGDIYRTADELLALLRSGVAITQIH
jgi:UDP-N-acetylmuramate--alanine ligase